MSTILILEDDAGLRFTFTTALKGAGHSVHSVSDVAAGIAYMKSTKPDIILLDLMIGGETSMEIANFAGYSAPQADVIFITGTQMFPAGELFQMVPNTRLVLRKPIRMDDLIEVVDHVSRNRGGAKSEAHQLVC